MRYITSNNEYYRVGGSALWQKMQDEKILEGRGWMSMRNHFREIIMNKVKDYPFLTNEELSSLRERTGVKDKEGKVLAGQVRAGLPWTKEEDAAMLSFIEANQEYAKPGGSKLWKKMDEDQPLEGRTARSMQRHYNQTLKKKKLSSVEDKEEEETEVDEEEVDEVSTYIIVNF